MKKKQDKTLLVRCDKELIELLDVMAERIHSNRSQVVRMILYKTLEDSGIRPKEKLLTVEDVWNEAKHNLAPVNETMETLK